MKITYAGRTILTDPLLAQKDAYEPFAGIARNPTIELPFQVEEILKAVQSVIVSHDHPDHYTWRRWTTAGSAGKRFVKWQIELPYHQPG